MAKCDKIQLLLQIISIQKEIIGFHDGKKDGQEETCFL